jgi:ATP-dependent DNA helicase RecG
MADVRGLKTSIPELSGVGPAAKAGYAELGIATFSDLLLLSPRTWEDRSKVHPLGLVQDSQMANTLVEVLSHSYFGKNRTLKIIVRDVSNLGDGRLSLLCFGRNFLEKTIKVGRIYYLYGSVKDNRGELQCSQFELYPATEDGDFPKQFGRILPIYPLRGSLSHRLIRANIKAVLESVDTFEDELTASMRDRYHLMTTDQAIRGLSLSSLDRGVAASPQDPCPHRTLLICSWSHAGALALCNAVPKTGPSIPTKLELKVH